MKALPLEVTAEAARELKKAGRQGYLVLTRNGKPVAYVLPTAHYDEEDIGYMTDPEFWKMIRERRQEGGGISLEELKAELAAEERTEREAASPRTSAGRKSKNGKKKASQDERTPA